MADKSPAPRLQDIADAIEHTQSVMEGVSIDAFEGDLTRRRTVERNIEIISEASRRLPDDLKNRYPEIPWKDIASIGNVLRHDYEKVIPDALWRVVRDDLPTLEKVCKAELMREKLRQAEPHPRDTGGRSR
jgi:uncharacterized protein with HEPN domain